MTSAPKSISNKTVLITGSAKRLGKTVALAMAKQGYNIIVHYRSSKREAEETADEIRSHGVSAWLVQGDISKKEDTARIWQESANNAGTIDILINNASIFDSSHLSTFTDEELLTNINIHALHPLHLCRLFKAQAPEGASIINFLDTRICEYDHAHAAYHLSKRMLFTLTRMMALEFAPHIRVNAVAPGVVMAPSDKDETYLQQMAETNPLRIHGSPAQIAETVLFLLSAPFVTGQIIFVDGGKHMLGGAYGC